VGLGAQKEMSVEVVAYATTNVHEEVVGTGVAGAKINATAGWLVAVESSALPADATHEIEAGLLADAGLEYAVEVKKKGPVGLALG